MNSKDAVGILGESRVISELIQKGYEVYTQFSGKSAFDIAAYKDGRFFRVEVKSTSKKSASGRYTICLRKVRHNRKRNLINNFDSTSCDLLAVYLGPIDQVRLIDASTIKNRGIITID